MTARGLAAAMSHGVGWTAGQYRLARAVLGLSTAWYLAQAIAGGPGTATRATVLLTALAAAVLAAAGVRARVMLATVLVAVAALPGAEAAAPSWRVPLVVLLAAHLLVPASPSGASAAGTRGFLPRSAPVSAASFAWLAAWSTLAAPVPWWVGTAAGVVLLIVPGIAGVRPWAWAGLVALWIAGVARGPAASDVFEIQLLALALDPAWIPPRWPARADRVFYDGTCALCHGAVRFLLAEDRTGTAFTFGPLHGRTWHATVPADVRAELPDSVIVQTADGHLYARTAAVIYLLERLGGVWRVLGTVIGLVPRRPGDAIYDAVARVRGRVFGRMPAECPLPGDLRSRLVD